MNPNSENTPSSGNGEEGSLTTDPSQSTPVSDEKEAARQDATGELEKALNTKTDIEVPMQTEANISQQTEQTVVPQKKPFENDAPSNSGVNEASQDKTQIASAEAQKTERTDLTMQVPKKPEEISVETSPTKEEAPKKPAQKNFGAPIIRTFHADSAYAQGKEHMSNFAPSRAPSLVKKDGTEGSTEPGNTKEKKEGEDPLEGISHDASIIPPDHFKNIDSLHEGRDLTGTGKSVEKIVTPETTSSQKTKKVNTEDIPLPQAAGKPKESKAPLKKSIVRTYEDDSAQALEDKDASVVSIAMAERNKQEKESEDLNEGRPLWQKSVIILAVVLMFVVGIGAIAYVGFTRLATQEETVIPSYTPLVLTETREEVDISDMSPGEIHAELQSFIENGGSESTVKELLLFTTTVTEEDAFEEPLKTEQLFNSLDLAQRAPLVRFLGERFMIGTFNHETIGTFWLFTVEDFENAFGNMLSWEQSIGSDISYFFPNKDVTPPTSSENGSATTTEETSLRTLEFIDLVVENRDVRALQDQFGNIHLLYSFPIRSALIIASDIETFKEILERVERRVF